MPKGGGAPIPQKTTFSLEVLDKNCTIDRVRQIMIISEKKVEKVVPFQNAAILLIFLLHDCAIPRKLKNNFPESKFHRNL